MLIVFFVVPFGIMVAVSFFRRQQGGFYTPDFVLDNYARFLSAFFGSVLGFSLVLAALVAVGCVAPGLPLHLSTGPRRGAGRSSGWWRCLPVLSLSEVIIGFAWSTLFSRTAGISNLLVWLGLMEQPVALLPGFGAVLTAWSIRRCPIPCWCSIRRWRGSIRRWWRRRARWARRRSAPSSTSSCRRCATRIFATLIMVFVFALGSYLLPQMLGRPQHWTLSVLITDQAIYQSNMPFAAAMAVFLVLVTLALVGLTLLVGRKEDG